MIKIENMIKKIFSNKLISNFSVYSIGRIIAALVSMLLLPLFTKKLPQSEFGIIGVLWLAVPLMSRVINLGMDVAVGLKFFKLDKKELSLYLYNALLGITLCGLAIWVIGLWQINLVHLIFDQDMSRAMFSLFSISILSMIYTTMMRSFFQFSGKAIQNVVTTILPSIFVSGTTFFLIMFIDPSYTSYIIGMAVGNGIFGLMSLIYFFNKYAIKYFHPSWPIIKRLLRVGLPVLPGTIGGIILASGDRYIIKIFMGLEAVAVYTLGYRFAEYILFSFFQPFQKALTPVLYEKAASNFIEASEYNNKIVNSTLVFFPLLISIVAIVSKDVIAWFGGGGYSQSYLIFIVALLGILIYNTAQIYGHLINFLERTELSTLGVLLGAGMNIGLNVWLIPQYGIVAAAFTTILSYLFMLILTVIIINHFLYNKINLFSILSRIIPLGVYLFAIYCIDNIIQDIILWQTYVLKSGLFILFFLITFFIFPELRYNIKRVISYFRMRTI